MCEIFIEQRDKASQLGPVRATKQNKMDLKKKKLQKTCPYEQCTAAKH